MFKQNTSNFNEGEARGQLKVLHNSVVCLKTGVGGTPLALSPHIWSRVDYEIRLFENLILLILFEFRHDRFVGPS